MTRILKDEPLWKRTTFRIGGPAQRLASPESLEELAQMTMREPASFILGGGANLLVSDAGVKGTVLFLGPEFAQVRVEEKSGGRVSVRAGAAMNLTRLCGMARKLGLAGMEFCFGIPGTLGGALVMNAGTREGEMKDITESVSVVAADGRQEVIDGKAARFGYRSSQFPEGCVITGATLSLKKGSIESIGSAMRRIHMDRKTKQPLDLPSAGSVFKNPPRDFAGRLLEEAGLKGERIGAAMVSPRHSNFIVNMGGATARDAHRLINLARRRVFESSGVSLEMEVRLVGEFDDD